MVGLKTVTYAKLPLKMTNPRDIAGNVEEEDAPDVFQLFLMLFLVLSSAYNQHIMHREENI